ncbi:MAG TPA: head maturation protease, ClpP-related [Bacteroidia bacterium]|jgi:ATP-dependent Clp endopeptidase proteolytic subunit ClpP|nr:head maturation protease, ClpP-related [Bacteroidia bacterium]
MSETHIYVYGQIGQGGITAESIRKKLANTSESIVAHINSPGGEVYEGYTIYNLLRNCGKPVNVVIEGLCASIATLIACAGDKITMNPTAEFMIHNPMVGIEGNAEDLRKVADQLDNIKKTIIAAYKRKTNKSEDELWQMMDKATFLSAEQAKDFGFVDEVSQGLKMVAYVDVTKFKTENTMDQKILESINNLGKKIEGLFKSAPKNLDATLEDGSKVFIETEDEILEGKAIFKVTEQGNAPLEDGSYALADARIIVVKDGKVESVAEPAAQDDSAKQIEDLKAQIEQLTNQLTEKDVLIENSKKESEALAVTVTEIKNEFDKVRNTVIGSDKNPKNVHITPKDEKGNDYVNGLANLINNKK